MNADESGQLLPLRHTPDPSQLDINAKPITATLSPQDVSEALFLWMINKGLVQAVPNQIFNTSWDMNLLDGKLKSAVVCLWPREMHPK